MTHGEWTRPISRRSVGGGIFPRRTSLLKALDRYLYRAVDSQGKTIEFLLTAHRDAQAAKRFLCKALKAVHNQETRVINVDKNAAYPKAINEISLFSAGKQGFPPIEKRNELKEKKQLSEEVELRQNKYLNNRIEQDHRFIKWLVKPGRGFKSFNTAQQTIKGYEIMHMLKKGQIEKVEPVARAGFPRERTGVGKGAVRERIKFIAEIFGVAA